MTERVIACTGCGEIAPEGDIPATWTFQVSERGRTYMCPVCARLNIRSIEGKLDEAWW